MKKTMKSNLAKSSSLLQSALLTPEQLSRSRFNSGRSPVTGVTDSLQLKSFSTDTRQLDTVIEDYKGGKDLPMDQSSFNPRVMENWIDISLRNAEDLEIPGCLKIAEATKSMTRYGVDRGSLLQAGLSVSEWDRLYRALFVYSTGFNGIINDVLRIARNKYAVASSLWKVYAILLEYSWHVDYAMIIHQLAKEGEDDNKQLSKEYESQINKLWTDNTKLQNAADEMVGQIQSLEIQRQKEQQRAKELEEELDNVDTGVDQEMELRVQYEGKLNVMFVAQREMETKLKQYEEKEEMLNQNISNKAIQIERINKHLQKSRLETKNLQMQQRMQAQGIGDDKAQLTKIKQELEMSEMKNKNLQSRYDQMDNTLKELNLKFRNANESIEKHQRTIASQQNEISNYVDQTKKLKKENAELSEKLETMDKNYEELKLEAKDTKQVLAEMSEKYNFYREKFEDVKKEKEKYEDMSIKLESQLNKKTEVWELQDETISKLKADIRSSIEIQGELTKARKFAENKYAENLKQLNRFREGYTEMKDQFSEMQQKYDQCSKKLEYADDRIKNMGEFEEQFKNRCFNEKEILQKKLDTIEKTTIRSLKKEKMDWLEKYHKAALDLEEAQTKRDKYNRKKKDRKFELFRHQNVFKEIERKCESERYKAALIQEKYIKLQLELKESNFASTEANQLAKVTTMNCGDRLMVLQNHNKKVVKIRDYDVRRHEMNLEEMRTIAAWRTQTIFDLKETITQKKEKIEKTKGKLNIARINITNRDDIISTQDDKIEKLKEEKYELKQQLKKEKKTIEDTIKRCQELSSQLENAQTEVSELKGQNDLQNWQIADLEEAIEVREAKIRRAQEKNASLIEEQMRLSELLENERNRKLQNSPNEADWGSQENLDNQEDAQAPLVTMDQISNTRSAFALVDTADAAAQTIGPDNHVSSQTDNESSKKSSERRKTETAHLQDVNHSDRNVRRADTVAVTNVPAGEAQLFKKSSYTSSEGSQKIPMADNLLPNIRTEQSLFKPGRPRSKGSSSSRKILQSSITSRDFEHKRSLTQEHLRSLNMTPNPGIGHSRAESINMTLPSARDDSPGQIRISPEQIRRRPPMVRLKSKLACHRPTQTSKEQGIGRWLKQANSRNKDNYTFL